MAAQLMKLSLVLFPFASAERPQALSEFSHRNIHEHKAEVAGLSNGGQLILGLCCLEKENGSATLTMNYLSTKEATDTTIQGCEVTSVIPAGSCDQRSQVGKGEKSIVFSREQPFPPVDEGDDCDMKCRRDVQRYPGYHDYVIKFAADTFVQASGGELVQTVSQDNQSGIMLTRTPARDNATRVEAQRIITSHKDYADALNRLAANLSERFEDEVNNLTALEVAAAPALEAQKKAMKALAKKVADLRKKQKYETLTDAENESATIKQLIIDTVDVNAVQIITDAVTNLTNLNVATTNFETKLKAAKELFKTGVQGSETTLSGERESANRDKNDTIAGIVEQEKADNRWLVILRDFSSKAVRIIKANFTLSDGPDEQQYRTVCEGGGEDCCCTFSLTSTQPIDVKVSTKFLKWNACQFAQPAFSKGSHVYSWVPFSKTLFSKKEHFCVNNYLQACTDCENRGICKRKEMQRRGCDGKAEIGAVWDAMLQPPETTNEEEKASWGQIMHASAQGAINQEVVEQAELGETTSRPTPRPTPLEEPEVVITNGGEE